MLLINPAIFGILILALILAIIKNGTFEYLKKEGTPWQLKFLEIWNNFISYSIGGLIGYYFFTVRWGMLLKGEQVTIADFALILLMSLSFFGHLPVLSRNISEGTSAILKRVLEGK